jgi:histidinol-phosphatase (PHP family)
MAWTNYHCHCDLCDGEEGMRAYVEAALDRGFSALGFSSHAPLPFPASWCLGRGARPAALESYRREVDVLRRFYRGRIDVRAGLEVDYIPGLMGPSDSAFAAFDYRIGSIHFVGATAEGRPWQMDDTPETFARGLSEQYDGDIRPLVADYYRALIDMVRFERPDIVGHLNLVKKYNKAGRYFDEGEAWYVNLVDGVLRAIAESGCLVELNTGGMARGWTEEPYPSPWILRRCRDLGIPMVLDSDCHRSADIDFGFREAAKLLLSCGYSEIMELGAGGWSPAAFDERGLKPGPMTSAA